METQRLVPRDEPSTAAPDYTGPSLEEIKEQKFKTLYQCRYILSKYGTMQERQICARQLKQMVKNK